MIRSIAVIAWAILLSNPALPKKQARAYAKTLQKTAKDHNFDPFSGIAIIHSESRWRQSVISPDGEDYGLGQIRARYVKGCRGDKDPVKHPSASCKAAKARLLDGHHNIRRLGVHITQWRKTCRRITKRPALFHRWLHGYGGMGRPRKGGGWTHICGQRRTKRGWRDLPKRKAIRNILAHRRRLIHKLRRKRLAERGGTTARSRRAK